jgi:UDP-GlcNAc3NAcA epimerase
MKVLTVVGARPQFIKCAPVSRALRQVGHEVLVHTGQHYDDNMSAAFFRDLDLPPVDHHLGVGSGPYGTQVGEMLKRLDEVLRVERPDYVVVYGDTNSTLAGALAAAGLHIPVAHVEAGLRSFNRKMLEEINRVVTDHLSSLLLCPTDTAVGNLAREGISAGVHLVGDVMRDALLVHLEIAEQRSRVLEHLGLRAGEYLLATVHRAENTDDAGRLRAIVAAFARVGADCPVVWPMHPRTRKQIEGTGTALPDPQVLRVVEPVSYLDMLRLEQQARAILTDSGGVQKEAHWLKVPCVTLRDETEWVETLRDGANVLVGADTERIVAAVRMLPRAVAFSLSPEDGQAAARTVALLQRECARNDMKR